MNGLNINIGAPLKFIAHGPLYQAGAGWILSSFFALEPLYKIYH